MSALRFTSALYLGLGHPSSRLPAWPQLSLGRPAILGEPQVAVGVAEGFAAMVGAEAAVTASSTLHLAIDLFPLLARPGATIYVDDAVYPISQWGIERAAARGARVRTFASHDTSALAALLEADAPLAHPPVVATDALCPRCGRLAPLDAYNAIVRMYGGVLVVDESQAIGVIGVAPDEDHPYGVGGGGACMRLGVLGNDVVRFASLAKGLGAPVAVLAGSRPMIEAFRARADTRVHCSPAAVPNLLAAQRGLAINARWGDLLRARLADRVTRFRQAVAALGLLRSRTLFPVQPLRIPEGQSPIEVAGILRSHGATGALTQGDDGTAELTLVFTAAHTPGAIDVAVRAVRAAFAERVRRAG